MAETITVPHPKEIRQRIGFAVQDERASTTATAFAGSETRPRFERRTKTHRSTPGGQCLTRPANPPPLTTTLARLAAAIEMIGTAVPEALARLTPRRSAELCREVSRHERPRLCPAPVE